MTGATWLDMNKKHLCLYADFSCLLMVYDFCLPHKPPFSSLFLTSQKLHLVLVKQYLNHIDYYNVLTVKVVPLHYVPRFCEPNTYHFLFGRRRCKIVAPCFPVWILIRMEITLYKMMALVHKFKPFDMTCNIVLSLIARL